MHITPDYVLRMPLTKLPFPSLAARLRTQVSPAEGTLLQPWRLVLGVLPIAWSSTLLQPIPWCFLHPNLLMEAARCRICDVKSVAIKIGGIAKIPVGWRAAIR